MRIAVVSPFLDKAHGTERCIVEQIERFVGKPDCEIPVYAQSIRDFDAVRWDAQAASSGKIFWHRISTLGPHLLNFRVVVFREPGAPVVSRHFSESEI